MLANKICSTLPPPSITLLNHQITEFTILRIYGIDCKIPRERAQDFSYDILGISVCEGYVHITDTQTGRMLTDRGAITHLNSFFCLLFSFKFNKSKSLWITSRFIPGYADVNYIATLPKHPLNPTVIDIFGKKLLLKEKEILFSQYFLSVILSDGLLPLIRILHKKHLWCNVKKNTWFQ